MLVAIPLLAPLARKIGLVDRSGGDPLKIHSGAVPLVGGPAILVGAIVAAFILPTFGRFYDEHNIMAIGFYARLLVSCVFLTIVGAVDDVKSLPPWSRLAAQVLAAGFFCFFTFQGDWLMMGGGILFAVGAINALNMQDGMDGLAGSAACLSTAGAAVVITLLHGVWWNWPPILVSGACLGFLLWNRPPAKVFLGDSGAYALGMFVAAHAVTWGGAKGGWQGIAGAVLLVGLPVLDAAAAIVRRLARGQSPFKGDRDHLYDLLAKKGWSPWKVLVTSCVVQALLVGSGVWLLTGTR
ncbi:MAG: glycosyltransferase family 4 protein [Planctomycetota bacterium]